MQDFDSFTREEFEHAHSRVNRLRDNLSSLVTISARSHEGEWMEALTGEAVRTLRAIACSVEWWDAAEEGFISCAPAFAASDFKRMTSSFASRVTKTNKSLLLAELDQRPESERATRRAEINSYLGVPIYNSAGSVVAVLSVFGGKGRHFGDEDEWWLQIAGNMFAGSRIYKDLKNRMQELEAVLFPGTRDDHYPVAEEKHTVLVIDDDRPINDLICEFLNMQGYAVDSAFNGVEAIQKFQPAKHDLVITDVAMPLMNGWELIAALRVRAPSLPIILISGYNTAEWNQAYLNKQGVSAVLRKPLDLAELASAIGRLVPATALRKEHLSFII